MLEVAELGSDDVVYDLGSGDGRILFIAVNEFKAKKAVGYELDKHLCYLTSQEIKRQSLEDRIKIVNEDLFKAELSEATVITLYLTTLGNTRLKPKLTKQAMPGTRIVSRSFKISGWIPSKTKYYSQGYIYLYKTPKSYLKMFNLIIKRQDNRSMKSYVVG